MGFASLNPSYVTASPSPRRPELVRRGAGLLAEEAGEMGRVGEGEI